MIDDGFVRPEIKTKHDKCNHGKFGWEDCEECCSAAIRALKSSPKQDNALRPNDFYCPGGHTVSCLWPNCECHPKQDNKND